MIHGKKIFLSTFLAGLIFSNSANSLGFNFIDSNNTESNITVENMFANNEAIIVFKKGTAASKMASMFEQLFGNGFKHNEYSLINGMHIIVPNKSFEEIKSMIENAPFINQYIESIEKNYASKISVNDPFYTKQWAFENSGQDVNGASGTKDADMDIKEAWQVEKGNSNAVVAVLDTGVDYTHSDLADNMWNGNKFHGYDFAGDNDGNNDEDPMPDKPYSDNGHFHGTHIAGIIGAVTDNSNGIAGVAQNVQIMAIKVFRPNGYGYTSDILEGLDFINKQIDNGVNIVAVNASYGSSGGKKGDSMDQAIQKLGEKGVVFCVAAGNEGKDIDKNSVYPASYSATNIITVAASDQNDKLADFSNYGKSSVEVAAPGVNILSTYPDNQYAYAQGTSMATPYVTGTIALMASAAPETVADEKIKAILNSVDKKESLKEKISTSGRVNSYSALKLITNKADKNSAPIAKDDTATAKYETAVIIDVLKNDSDADGDALSIKDLTAPKNGTTAIKNNKIEYKPNKGFSGKDEFNYTVFDNKGGEAKAKVTVFIKEKPNAEPITKNDTATTEYETAVIIDVLKNDSDADGDTLSIESVENPKNGNAIIKDNKIEYKPNRGFSGKDEFSYIVSDGNGGKSKAVVTVTVKEKPNTPPVAKDDTATAKYKTAVIIDVLKNDSDADGDSLTIKSITSPNHGTAVIKNSKIEYKPQEGYYGKDSFNYTVSDSKGAISTAEVTVKIIKEDVTNTHPVTKNDTATTEYETAVTIDVLKNDSDADGDTLSIESVENPKNGNAIIKDNKIEYKPNRGFSGKDEFSYIVSDGNGGKSKAVVTVTVKEKPNTPPVAKDDTAYTEYETPVTVDVLKNDTDADGDALRIKSISSPKNGKAVIENSSIKYIPNKEYSGSDTFVYKIADSNGAVSQATVTVMVKAKEDINFNHFPIIDNSNIESVIKIYTQFTKEVYKNYTEFNLNKKAKIKLFNDGSIKLEESETPLPKEKLPNGTRVEVKENFLKIDLKMKTDYLTF